MDGGQGPEPAQGPAELRWDWKKKRLVGQSGQEDKEIKTESGRYISSSYKRELS